MTPLSETAVNLREERLRRGHSLKAMAAEIGVSTRVLQLAETGSVPHARHAVRIATYFGVDVVAQWPLEDRSAA